MITGKSIQALKSNFSRESLRKLAEEGDGLRLSLFMPLSKTGREVMQSPILLKDLRSRSVSALAERGSRPDEIADILVPIDQLLEETDFSLLQGDGLAVFSSRDHSASFLMPMAPVPMVEAGKRYLLDPLLPLLFEDGRFHLLTLSLDAVRLWWVDRRRMREIPLRGIQTRFKQATSSEDYDAYFNSRVHPGGMRPAKEKKRDILDFFHQVDRGLRALLQDSELPLMLAGVESLIPVYREANTLPFLVEQAVMGNPEVFLEKHALHAKAWSAYRESRALEKARVLALYRERLATPQAVAGLVLVLPAARQGRIQHLFLRKGYRQKGFFNPDEDRVLFEDRPGSGEDDLVNLACIHALMTGAKVHILEAGEIPEKEEIAALCRY